MNENEVEKYRHENLYEILRRSFSDEWTNHGKYLRNKTHDSCIVRSDGWWFWNSRAKSGKNPIDFMVLFYNFSFSEAIQIIKSNSTENLQVMEQPNKENSLFRDQSAEALNKIKNYLTVVRKLDPELINNLIIKGLILPVRNRGHTNICFYNPNNAHYEITGITDSRFKQSSSDAGYWSFKIGKNEDEQNAYICESAIDAISLYQLQETPGTYISIAGCGKSKTIKNIIADYQNGVIAVDNDDAGNNIAKMFKNLERLIPLNKDWNEDLVAQKINHKTIK